MSWWQDFHFMRPYWLLALPLLFFLYRGLVKTDKIQSSWANVCDEHLLNFLLVKGENKQRKLPYILSLFILFFIIISLSGPTWVKKNNPTLSVDNPVMIMLNMSGDMWAKDVSPSRFIRAKYLIKDLLQEFKSTESGLLVYSSEPYVITPMTEDANIIDNILPALEMNIMPEDGDRLDRAVNLAVERLQSSGYSKGNLIILTADAGERFDAALESAANARDNGFEVNIIKVSDAENEKLPMIAEKGGGIYVDYKQSLSPLSSKINDVLKAELKQSENMQTVWEDMGYYLLWLPAFLLLYYFRSGVLAIVMLCIFSDVACAGWFLNDNQEAMGYFENQQYDKAQDKFTDSQWKGAAAYKNGDFSTAYNSFLQGDDVTSLYNQGNALAKGGKIAEAIAKYEEVLKKDSSFEDAQFNLDYLKQMQQQQEQQQQNKNKQEQEDKQQSVTDSQKQKQKQDEQSNKEENQEQQVDSQENNSQQEQQQEQADKQQNNNPQKQSQNAQNNEESQQDNENGNEQQPSEQKQQNEQESVRTGNKDKQESSTKQNNQQEQQDSDDGKQIETEQQAQYGDEDENSEKTAQALQTQAGDKDDEQREKLRTRTQFFREIPEDKGGLIRAFIALEHAKNRYKDE